MKSVAIVGSGPAALMAAEVLSQSKYHITIFEKRNGPARKLFIAGSSGLNITNHLPAQEFAAQYSGPRECWESWLQQFTPLDWLNFIHGLDLKTFEGTSGRYFVETMNAAQLVRRWRARLSERGVIWNFNHECVGFTVQAGESLRLSLAFANGETSEHDVVCFALGGGSWEPEENPLRWPNIFKSHGLAFENFRASNVGFHVKWPEAFLKEAEGQALKNIALHASKGTRKGDLVVTSYGLEGTPIYSIGETGDIWLDLKPDLSPDQILERCLAVRENLSPIRRIKKQLNLSDAALALLYHLTPQDIAADLERLIVHLKKFPLHLEAPRPLSESISAAGGLALSELDENMMLKKFPAVFAAGEMLDWDAPTGGFLIQACVTQGFVMGHAAKKYLKG